MISRRDVSLAFGASLLVALPLLCAQSGAAVRKIGLLSAVTPDSAKFVFDSFKLGLRELGWVEGRNVEYRPVFAGGDLSRMDALAADLLAQKVDLIFLANRDAAFAAQRATKTTPIIFVSIANPVRLGLIQSLAKPGGNITGLSSQGEDVVGKQIEILHEVAPRARRYAIEGYDSYSPSFRGAIHRACQALGLEILSFNVDQAEQLEPAVAKLVADHADALVMIASPAAFMHRARVIEMLHRTRIPVMYSVSDYVRGGGLISYAADFRAMARSAARFVDKILKGTNPGDLPVEQPTKFEMVVNLKTAKALGLTIPYSVMLRATEVIE